uniref:Glycine N-acyltransferase-like protein n=1 Tax=Angiostrongylus cantonensis TaxID=6313 RepID=A0A0K0DQ79_ANGCA
MSLFYMREMNALFYFEISTYAKESKNYQAANAEEYYMKRIRHLPSSCVRETSTGNVVSYELRSFVGTMADQYTMPEHRRQGLGLAVEMTYRCNFLPIFLIAALSKY